MEGNAKDDCLDEAKGAASKPNGNDTYVKSVYWECCSKRCGRQYTANYDSKEESKTHCTCGASAMVASAILIFAGLFLAKSSQ